MYKSPKDEFPKPEECVYTSCYCEENIWKLCEKLKDNNSLIEKCYAVFMSNDRRLIPLWCQRSASEVGNKDGKVIWDYHVFLVRKGAREANVYDFDSTLPFPSTFQAYVNFAIRSEEEINPQFHRMFRVIPAEIYLRSFASDRRHMKKNDGSWLKDPPPYEPIKCEESNHNIDDFISMKRNNGPGQVMNLMQFVQFFSPAPTI